MDCDDSLADDDAEVIFLSQRRDEAVRALSVLERAGISAEMGSRLGFGTILVTNEIADEKAWTYEVAVASRDADSAMYVLSEVGLESQMPDEHLVMAEKPWVVSYRKWLGRFVVLLLAFYLLAVLSML